jgi:ketosteroid isomerase-like protein
LVARYLTAYEARNAAGCGDAYTENALLLSPWGPPVRGPQAISAAHLIWFEEDETNKFMTIADLEIDGNLAICLVKYSTEVSAEKGSARVFGASLNTLQRQPDGNWKFRFTSLTELADGETGFEK